MSTTNTEEVMNGKKRLLREVELPVDVVEEILMRLPAEYLLRCKLLSKTYYRLISNPNFIKNHLLFHQQPPNTNMAVMTKIPGNKNHTLRIMRPHSSSNWKSSHLDYLPPGRYPLHRHDKEIVGSCNGLLCVQLTSMNTRMLSHTLWNPTTGEMFNIRNPKLDGHLNSSSHGFGYDARCGGDYKLVKIVKDGLLEAPTSPFTCQIWRLSTNQWTEIGQVLPGRNVCPKHKVQRTALLIRNNLYWLAHNHVEYIIFSFDMNTDSAFREVTMPEYFPGKGFHPETLNNFRGSLAIFTRYYISDYLTSQYCVWVRDDDDDDDDDDDSSSWTKKMTFLSPFSECMIPTEVSINGNFVIKLYANYTCFEFYLHGPHGLKKVETEIVHHKRGAGSEVTLWCFTGSLVSINNHYLNHHQQSTRKRNRQGQQLVSGPMPNK